MKLGKTGEPDPDPLPYLVVSMEMKRNVVSTVTNSGPTFRQFSYLALYSLPPFKKDDGSED